MSEAKTLFLETADRIGRALCRDALWDGPRCTWLGWSMEPVNQAWTPAYRSFGPELYSGTSGIALFLAELYAITDDHELRRTLEGGVNQALSLLPTLEGGARIGFYSGVTGIAYALARIATLLGHAPLLQRALDEAAQLADLAPDPCQLDVIGGSAGAIPALLALAALGQARHSTLLDLAVRHGELLLATALQDDRGWSWDTMHVPGQPPLTGHSHGTAGIATALLELHAATGDTRFHEAALGAQRYERSLFSAEHRNWPDLRLQYSGPGTPPTYCMAWCHGAPGIGLSRLRNLQLQPDDPTLPAEIEVAVQTTAATLAAPWQPGQGNFSLCHGAAGNAELLLEAGRHFQRPDLTALAEKVGREGYLHYAQPDLPWPCGVAGVGETPNLLLGTAGIGHFYLRLYDPVRVPSVLCAGPLALGGR